MTTLVQYKLRTININQTWNFIWKWTFAESQYEKNMYV